MILFGYPYKTGKLGQVAGTTNQDVLLTKMSYCLQLIMLKLGIKNSSDEKHIFTATTVKLQVLARLV